MKTEPGVFSLEDLRKRPGQQEPWDGVRNYQARNYLRAMRLGDGILFYHSNCPIPGVVGLAEVASLAYTDPTQFDPQDPHHDPRSDPANPRWDLVDVRFVRIFPRTVSLDELKGEPTFADSPLIRKGNRLSVLPVSEAQWKAVLALAEGPA